MKRTSLALVVVGSFLLAGSAPAAYKVVPVTNGGKISGQVKFTGAVPKAEVLPVTKNQEQCGASKTSEVLLVSAKGGVKYAVVTIQDIPQGKAPDPAAQPEIDNASCSFVPHVQSVTAGATLNVKNADPILHNTHAYLNGTETVFNLALPLQNQVIKRPLPKPGLINVKCDAGHTWMSAFIIVSENPYHSVTGEDGTFSIADVPPGTYTVKVWHETLGTQTQKVTVAAGGTATANFSFASAPANKAP